MWNHCFYGFWSIYDHKSKIKTESTTVYSYFILKYIFILFLMIDSFYEIFRYWIYCRL